MDHVVRFVQILAFVSPVFLVRRLYPMSDGLQAKVMGSEEARREWRTVLDTVLAGEDVVVERYSRPAVAVIAYDDYAAILHELEEIRATRRMEQLRAAWQQGKIK